MNVSTSTSVLVSFIEVWRCESRSEVVESGGWGVKPKLCSFSIEIPRCQRYGLVCPLQAQCLQVKSQQIGLFIFPETVAGTIPIISWPSVLGSLGPGPSLPPASQGAFPGCTLVASGNLQPYSVFTNTLWRKKFLNKWVNMISKLSHSCDLYLSVCLLSVYLSTF